MHKTYYALIMALTMLCACQTKQEQTAAEITHNADLVIVSNESPILRKLQYTTLALQPFASEFRTVGTVEAETGKLAEVCVPFDGRIVQSHVSLGTQVRAGQSLMSISSPDFLDASKSHFQNRQNYEKAKADYDRKVVLTEHGIAAQKELEEAKAEMENARHEMEYSAAALRAWGTNPETLRMGQPMTITAPIAGEVVKNDITVGAFVKADSEPMLTIADLRKVWVNARVKEHFIGIAKEGGKVEVRSEACEGKVIEGTILHVGNMVDEETRSVQVIIACDNQDLSLGHGMFVSVHFLGQAEDCIVVPSTAVFQGDEKSYVFVCGKEPGTFERRQVELGTSSDDNTLVSILGGLSVGEKIVAEGGLYLND